MTSVYLWKAGLKKVIFTAIQACFTFHKSNKLPNFHLIEIHTIIAVLYLYTAPVILKPGGTIMKSKINAPPWQKKILPFFRQYVKALH